MKRISGSFIAIAFLLILLQLCPQRARGQSTSFPFDVDVDGTNDFELVTLSQAPAQPHAPTIVTESLRPLGPWQILSSNVASASPIPVAYLHPGDLWNGTVSAGTRLGSAAVLLTTSYFYSSGGPPGCSAPGSALGVSSAEFDRPDGFVIPIRSPGSRGSLLGWVRLSFGGGRCYVGPPPESPFIVAGLRAEITGFGVGSPGQPSIVTGADSRYVPLQLDRKSVV